MALAHLHSRAGLWTVEEYVSRATTGRMDVNTPYQLPTVWTVEQRRNLMYSWLMGLPIPAVLLNSRIEWPNHSTEYAVVDGKQRIETALAWFRGELTIPREWLPTEWLTPGTSPMVGLTDMTKPRMVERLMDIPFVMTQVPTIRKEALLYVLITPADLKNAQRIANA